MATLPLAESITHQHLLCVVNTLIINTNSRGPIRILDAGCGNGKLISYLHKSLHLLHPEIEFHISGYDVRDHGVQAAGFLADTVSRLLKDIPEVDWPNKIHTIQANDQWTFASDKYDFIISNQVLEHVHDKDFFFKNISAHLVEGGYSAHLAPLKHIVHEGHIFLPWAHRISNFSALLAYIRLMSSLGFGKFPRHRRDTNCTLHEYSERHADYIYFWTSYATESETIQFARKNGLRADFRFSTDFYKAKLRQIFKRQPEYLYQLNRSGIQDAVSLKFLRYISSVTFVCKKVNTY